MDINLALAEAMDAVVKRVRLSLVAVRDGRRGLGAGIIWRAGGWIVTNNHVVSHGKVKVLLPNGVEVPANVVTRDTEIDLALLSFAQVEDVLRNGLTPAMVADSHGLRVGQYVMAIGHPWGEFSLVTGGLVSSLGTARIDGRRSSVEIIRSDVRLAPGNSGGPLVNAAGAVVGVNTMIVGGDMGLAIPSHLVSAFVDQALAGNDKGMHSSSPHKDSTKKTLDVL